ncbi:hypothetical protein BDL97_14G059900 [Sphagnum fallax]|jgi:hypothetical protein|nr:hypothetical protein BDL97_14G059900 [Sphagnum fallax]
MKKVVIVFFHLTIVVCTRYTRTCLDLHQQHKNGLYTVGTLHKALPVKSVNLSLD